MISIDQLDKLNVGDTFDAGKLIPGFSDEALVWMCISLVGSGRDRVATFEVSYFGVWVTRFTAYVNKKSGVSFKEDK